MKKLFNLTIVASLLYSQAGCIGAKPSNDTFPYATPEIKQKLAKAIDPSLTVVPDDFFETFDYANSDYDWHQIISVLDKPEEKWFWETLINMRLQMIGVAASMMQENISLENPSISPEVLSSVIAYEEAYPYKPNLENVDEVRKYLIAMALGNMPIPPSAEQAEAYIEQWGGLDTGKFFQQVREEILQYYKKVLTARQNNTIPEDYAAMQKTEAGITEYAVQMQAPALYPAELLIASFGLSKEDEDAVYVFHPMSFKNAPFASNFSIRIENEKPLPYNLTLAWYSIAENKNYVLKTDLPRQTLLAKLMGDTDKPWDALLVTLAPYGQVTLYAFNQITGKTEQLARYQAQEHSFSPEDFRQMDMMYQSAEAPAANWNEYQQMALKEFPKAAENLKANGLPEKDPSEKTYWNENPSAAAASPAAEPAAEDALKAMGMTPLHMAVSMGDVAKVQELISQGADVNAAAPNIGTPLLYACSVGNLEAARMLINAKADVNTAGDTGYTPLLMACQNGNAELVKLLISAGADVNVKHVMNGQETGLTPLKIAQASGFEEITQLLTQAGAK